MTVTPRSDGPGLAKGAESTGEPVGYMRRTLEYYEAQGFERPYVWAHHDTAPFQPLTRPLSESTLTLVTTANDPAPEGWAPGERRPLRRVYSVASDDPPDGFYTDDLSWHKEATHTDDLQSYFPHQHLAALRDAGRIGALSRRFHAVPTEYSHRRTLEQDAPEILRRCREDEVDVALLVPL